jgi:uncharacterized RDD family membrane protein YckC
MSENDAGWGGDAPAPAPAPGAYGKASGPRASFWRRFAAGFIDLILLAIVGAIVGAVVKDQNGQRGLGLLIGLAYTTYLEGGATGQSIGKKVMGTRVVDATTGGPIGYGRGAIRYLVGIVSWIACTVGYLWMLWDGEKQTWHDKASTSYVVPVSAYPISQG